MATESEALRLERYMDALESLSADQFESAEAYWTAQNIWSEVTDDLKRSVSHGPFLS